MANTVDLQITTNAFPTITADDVQIAIFDQGDSGAPVTDQQFSPPHNQRVWSFPGLPLSNYLFRIFQMVGNTSAVRQQLGGDTFVVPNSPPTVTYFEDEQIVADTTVGMASGVNMVVFDGTGGKEDWRGRDIATLVRMGGEGVMKKGVDYSWNTNTGELQLLIAGDLFNPGEWFNVTFALQVGSAPVSVPTILPPFLTPKVITANYAVNAGADFGGVLIIRPAGTYLEITMPAIATVPVNKRIKLEFDQGAMQQCAKIIFQAGEVLSWLGGNRPDLYMCPQESIYLYPFLDTDAVKRWRVDSPFGNWLKVGEQVVDDNIPGNVFNKVLLNGASLDSQQYARLYNDFVESLPPAEICDYDNWATGTNIFLYSKANSAVLANAGKFMIPNRQGQFERITDGVRTPGNQQLYAMPDHRHEETIGTLPATLFGKNPTLQRLAGKYNGELLVFCDFSGPMIDAAGNLILTATELRVTNIAVRKYLLV